MVLKKSDPKIWKHAQVENLEFPNISKKNFDKHKKSFKIVSGCLWTVHYFYVNPIRE